MKKANNSAYILTTFIPSSLSLISPVRLYIFLSSFLFIMVGLLWTTYISGTLYVCTDPIPLIGFIPSFVHPEFGDYWKTNPWIVRALWLSLVIFCLTVPYFIVKKTGVGDKK